MKGVCFYEEKAHLFNRCTKGFVVQKMGKADKLWTETPLNSLWPEVTTASYLQNQCGKTSGDKNVGKKS